MRVLITGASGFIGTRLAIRSRELGHEVVALGQVNNEVEAARERALRKGGVALQRIPVEDRHALSVALRGCDLVFHLAAAQHEANVPDSHFRNVNVEGTRNLLDAAVAAAGGRFVHGSTIGVYGSAARGELHEESPAEPDNIYGVTKLEGERLVLEYSDRLQVTVIRISETYGPSDRRLLKLFRAVKKGMFFVIGSGRNAHQLIYVDDLIDGLYAAAERDAALGQVFVLAGREVLSTHEMVATIARVLGVSMRRFRVPLWPFLAAAVVMEKTLTPLGIQPPLHRRRLDFFRKSFVFSTEKATRLLDFEPATDFATGATRTADWYRDQGEL